MVTGPDRSLQTSLQPPAHRGQNLMTVLRRAEPWRWLCHCWSQLCTQNEPGVLPALTHISTNTQEKKKKKKAFLSPFLQEGSIESKLHLEVSGRGSVPWFSGFWFSVMEEQGHRKRECQQAISTNLKVTSRGLCIRDFRCLPLPYRLELEGPGILFDLMILSIERRVCPY